MSEQYWGCLDKLSKVNFSPAETLHLGVIGVIDHKNTIAILHALVTILGDFLRIRRITLHYIGTVYASAV